MQELFIFLPYILKFCLHPLLDIKISLILHFPSLSFETLILMLLLLN